MSDQVFVLEVTTRQGHVPPARPRRHQRIPLLTGVLIRPLVHVFVPHLVLVLIGGVGHGAHAAPELGVDEVSGSLPAEVLVVEGVVGVELVQVGGQLARRREVVDVDVRVRWRHLAVVLGRRSHHHRDDVVPWGAHAHCDSSNAEQHSNFH